MGVKTESRIRDCLRIAEDAILNHSAHQREIAALIERLRTIREREQHLLDEVAQSQMAASLDPAGRIPLSWVLPTEAKALRVVGSVEAWLASLLLRLDFLRRATAAVEEVLATRDNRRFAEVFWWRDGGVWGTSSQLSISPAAVYRRRRQILVGVAVRMGLLTLDEAQRALRLREDASEKI